MIIKEDFTTKNRAYKNKNALVPKGVMLHSIGCAQPSASVLVKQFDSALVNKSVHGFIDANDGILHQTLPFNYKAGHCGGSGNSTHIGIEMCEPPSSCIKYMGGATIKVLNRAKALEYVTRTYNSAVQLFAYLCKKYNLNPLTQICSHNEGHKMGIASGHVDPEHLWNQLGTNYTMNGFRQAVLSMMQNLPPITVIPMTTTTKSTILGTKTVTTPAKTLGIIKHPQLGTVDFNKLDYSLIFDWQYYKNKYPDLVNAGYKTQQQFTDHFKTKGMLEGRQGNSTFNPVAYKKYNPDVAAIVGTDAHFYYAHYCIIGKQKGRRSV